MAKPDYNVTVPIDTANGGTYWHKIGAGFLNGQTGVISIFLNSLPIPGKDGKVKVMLFKDKDEEEREPARRPAQNRPVDKPTPSYAQELDDEIPF